MKCRIFLLSIVCSIIQNIFASPRWSYVENAGRPKVLHLSFHIGCIKDFEEVADELKLDLTSWYILGEQPFTHFDGMSTNNDIYNITAERAQAAWQRHKDFFDQFDVIITSDTAPLSRIFLHDEWKKPLIIWICNRFDYGHIEEGMSEFPDRAYYELFQKAAYAPHVRIVPYTDYEWLYAQMRGVRINHDTIRPLGSADDSQRFGTASLIPVSINPKDTLFIYPRLGQRELQYAQRMCESVGIPCYSGQYNGPGELTQYKAVLYFPYQWSNLALYENIQRGIIHFVPSRQFIKQLVAARMPVRATTVQDILFDFCEWYNPEYNDIIVYFDSWQDLQEKLASIDYETMQAKIKAFGKAHRQTVIAQWRQLFETI